MYAIGIRQAGASLKEEQKQTAEAALEEKVEAERRLNEAVKKSLIPNVILPGSRVCRTLLCSRHTISDHDLSKGQLQSRLASTTNARKVALTP